MTILALILKWMGVADEVVTEVLQLIQHAQNPTNVQNAKTLVTKATGKS